MIIKINTGTSFKGAAQYVLHDKREPGEKERTTTERVAWTETLNTLHDDPAKAIREMQFVAYNQNYLKQQAGHATGRPTTNAVMTISLSWEPEQKPDRAHMTATAKDFLQRMGWGEHQAVLTAHNDTKHTHLHVMLNTIHPETGMTLDANWYKTRAQKWGLAFEREQGHIYCKVREAKYGRGQEAEGPSMHHGEWQTWQRARQEREPEFRRALKKGEWTALKDAHRDARIEHWKQTAEQRRQLRGAIREEVRAEFKPQWQAYAKHRAERDQAAKLYDQEARRAQRHYRARGPLHGAASVKQIKDRQAAYHKQMREDLAKQRAAINDQAKGRTAELMQPALERLTADRAQQYKQMLAAQRDRRSGLQHDQAQDKRRPDTLARDPANQNQAGTLTVQQIKAYKDHAIALTAQRQQFGRTRDEVGGADHRSREDPRRHDPDSERRARTEQSDRAREQRGKLSDEEYRRQARVERLIAKRQADRDRERGGRDR